MESGTDNNLQTRAIEWHIRLRDGDDATWDAFADWLAQNPSHRKAYEAIEQADLAIEPLLPALVFQPPAARWLTRERGLAGAVLAASVAAALIFLPTLSSSRYEMSTRPGQQQTVALDADTQVTLNGSTRMTFDRRNPRFASLVSGEALFRVRHDSAHPFTLEIGNSRVKDVGTVFNAVRDHSQLRVTVAEGEVIYSARAQAVSLNAGQSLLAQSDSATVRVSAVPIASVGAWQKNRLLYSGEPLSQVAADLGRSLGIDIAVAPAIQSRPFSGTIVLDGAGPEQLQRLKMALNVDLEVGATGWTMKPLADDRP